MQLSLRHILTLAATFAPGLAMAEDVIRDILPRPANCAPLMTIQRHGCSVLTVLSCGDGDAVLWRTEAYDAEGFDYAAHDSEDGKVSIWADGSGEGGYFGDSSASHMTPLAEVAASGSGDSVMIGKLDMLGVQKPISIVGRLTRVEPPLTLDGINFTRIAGDAVVTMPSPMPPITVKNVVYFDPASGVAFEGESQASWPPSDGAPPHTPAAIILPGQPGFDEPYPTYDCGDISLNLTDEKADRS